MSDNQCITHAQLTISQSIHDRQPYLHSQHAVRPRTAHLLPCPLVWRRQRAARGVVPRPHCQRRARPHRAVERCSVTSGVISSTGERLTGGGCQEAIEAPCARSITALITQTVCAPKPTRRTRSGGAVQAVRATATWGGAVACERGRPQGVLARLGNHRRVGASRAVPEVQKRQEEIEQTS
jgi:hypothetical protein